MFKRIITTSIVASMLIASNALAQTVTVTYGEASKAIEVGSNTVTTETVDALKYLVEPFGMDITWNSDTSTIALEKNISYPKYIPFADMAVGKDGVYAVDFVGADGGIKPVEGNISTKQLPNGAVNKGQIWGIACHDSRLYYLTGAQGSDGGMICSIYSCNYDGSDNKLLVDDAANYGAFFIDNTIYYEHLTTVGGEVDGIFAFNIDTAAKTNPYTYSDTHTIINTTTGESYKSADVFLIYLVTGTINQYTPVGLPYKFLFDQYTGYRYYVDLYDNKICKVDNDAAPADPLFTAVKGETLEVATLDDTYLYYYLIKPNDAGQTVAYAYKVVK